MVFSQICDATGTLILVSTKLYRLCAGGSTRTRGGSTPVLRIGDSLSPRNVKYLQLCSLDNMRLKDVRSPGAFAVQALYMYVTFIALIMGVGNLQRQTITKLQLDFLGNLETSWVQATGIKDLKDYIRYTRVNVTSTWEAEGWNVAFAGFYFLVALASAALAVYPLLTYKKIIKSRTEVVDLPPLSAKLFQLGHKFKIGGKYFPMQMLLRELVEALVQGAMFLDVSGYTIGSLSPKGRGSKTLVMKPVGQVAYAVLLFLNCNAGLAVHTLFPPRQGGLFDQVIIIVDMLLDLAYISFPFLYYGGRVWSVASWSAMRHRTVISFFSTAFPLATMLSTLTRCYEVILLRNAAAYLSRTMDNAAAGGNTGADVALRSNNPSIAHVPTTGKMSSSSVEVPPLPRASVSERWEESPATDSFLDTFSVKSKHSVSSDGLPDSPDDDDTRGELGSFSQVLNPLHYACRAHEEEDNAQVGYGNEGGEEGQGSAWMMQAGWSRGSVQGEPTPDMEPAAAAAGRGAPGASNTGRQPAFADGMCAASESAAAHSERQATSASSLHHKKSFRPVKVKRGYTRYEQRELPVHDPETTADQSAQEVHEGVSPTLARAQSIFIVLMAILGWVVLVWSVLHIEHWYNGECNKRIPDAWKMCIDRVVTFRRGIPCDCTALEAWTRNETQLARVVAATAQHFTVLQHVWMYWPSQEFRVELLENVQMRTMRIIGASQQSAIGRLPDAFEGLSELEVLTFEETGLVALPPSFMQLEALHHLALSGNKFTTVPDPVRALKRLTYLNMAFSPVNQLPHWLLHTNLKQVAFAFGNLPTLPAWIKDWEIEDLAFMNMNLASLPDGIGAGRMAGTLRGLWLNFNPFLTSLPASFANFTALQTLRIDYASLCFRPGHGPWKHGSGFAEDPSAPAEVRAILSRLRTCMCNYVDAMRYCHASHLDDLVCHPLCNTSECGYDQLADSHRLQRTAACSAAGRARIQAECSYDCIDIFQRRYAWLDLNHDYSVTREEYLTRMGEPMHWLNIALKYSDIISTGVITPNQYANFYRSVYLLEPITCQACDYGCQRGHKDCYNFDYASAARW